jgi:hypothetical protein
MSNIVCKDPSCNFAYPILPGDSIGNSLSTLNLNFKNIDIQLCSLESLINDVYDVAINSFMSLSAGWSNLSTIINTNSSCWNNTFTTVSEMSGAWLSPITIVYPIPFSENTTDIESIRAWLNTNFIAKNGTAFNFIVGQEVYVFSPEYDVATRQLNFKSNVGTKTVKWTGTSNCQGTSQVVTGTVKVDCGSINTVASLPDEFINNFVGIRYVLDENLEWNNGTKIFN